MKSLLYYPLTILFILSSINLRAQGHSLSNIIWGNKNSNNIYIGVANKFLAPQKYDSLDFSSDFLTALVYNDTLVLFPKKTGECSVTAFFNTRKKKFVFNSSYLPMLDVRFNFDVSGDHIVYKNKLPEEITLKLYLPVESELEPLFGIKQYTITINGRAQTVSGNKIPSGIIEQIKLAYPGKELKINQVELFNKTTDIGVVLNMNKAYLIQ